jgi:hypothetical protein
MRAYATGLAVQSVDYTRGWPILSHLLMGEIAAHTRLQSLRGLQMPRAIQLRIHGIALEERPAAG